MKRGGPNGKIYYNKLRSDFELWAHHTNLHRKCWSVAYTQQILPAVFRVRTSIWDTSSEICSLCFWFWFIKSEICSLCFLFCSIRTLFCFIIVRTNSSVISNYIQDTFDVFNTNTRSEYPKDNRDTRPPVPVAQ